MIGTSRSIITGKHLPVMNHGAGENSAFGSATNGVTLINGGDGTATDNTKLGETTMANANQYLYLTCGASTDAAYTAGKVLIEIFGVLS